MTGPPRPARTPPGLSAGSPPPPWPERACAHARRRPGAGRRWRPSWAALTLGLLAAVVAVVAAVTAEDSAPDPRRGVWDGVLGERPIRVCIEDHGGGRYYEHRDRLPLTLMGGRGYYPLGDAEARRPPESGYEWALGDPDGDTLKGDLRAHDGEPLLPIHLRRLSPPPTPQSDPRRAGLGFCDTEPFTSGLYQPPQESVAGPYGFNGRRYRVHRVTSAYGTHPLRISRLELLDRETAAARPNAAAPLNAVLLAALPTTVAALRDDLWTARLRLLDDWGAGTALEEWAELKHWDEHRVSIAEHCEVRRGGETLARRVSYRTWAFATAAPVDPPSWFDDPQRRAQLMQHVRVRAMMRLAAANPDAACRRRLEANDHWQTWAAADGLVFATAFTDPADQCGTEVTIPYAELDGFATGEGQE